MPHAFFQDRMKPQEKAEKMVLPAFMAEPSVAVGGESLLSCLPSFLSHSCGCTAAVPLYSIRDMRARLGDLLCLLSA